MRWGADQRQELARLCRDITRPAIANERLKHIRAGQAVLQLKCAIKDGTRHIVMAPLELMQRLVALVPRPRLHLILFHGVLALIVKLRAAIIPTGRYYGQIFNFDQTYNPTRFWRTTFHDPRPAHPDSRRLLSRHLPRQRPAEWVRNSHLVRISLAAYESWAYPTP